jgi:hypothetical protein
MLTQIKTFEGNALALEMVAPFTEADATTIKQLFEEKLSKGYEHVNILIKVKDLSVLNHMELKAFLKGEAWGITHFSKIGKCAVVAHSDFMASIIKLENKALHFFNSALEEKYFDTEQLDEALAFISSGE